MKRSLILLLAAASLVTVVAVFWRQPAESDVRVFAAASLREALDAAVAAYPGVVTVSYGGSAAMARQIALGAPADLVVLANAQWMDWLAEQGALTPDSRVDLLSNRLVVVGPKGAAPFVASGDITTRLGDGRMAIGQSDSVPAGIYARAWLEAEGLWADLAGRLAETDNVRAALALVARGEAPLGVVYDTDARQEPGVSVVWNVDKGAHPPIVYPMAQVLGGRGDDLARFLRGPVAQEIFAAHGFIALEGQR